MEPITLQNRSGTGATVVFDIIIDNLFDTMRMHGPAQGLWLPRRPARPCRRPVKPPWQTSIRRVSSPRPSWEAVASVCVMADWHTKPGFTRHPLHPCMCVPIPRHRGARPGRANAQAAVTWRCAVSPDRLIAISCPRLASTQPGCSPSLSLALRISYTSIVSLHRYICLASTPPGPHDGIDPRDLHR